MSNLPKEIHNNTAVGGIVFEQTTFRDWCASNGLTPDGLNGYAFFQEVYDLTREDGYATLKQDYTVDELISIAEKNAYLGTKNQDLVRTPKVC